MKNETIELHWNFEHKEAKRIANIIYNNAIDTEDGGIEIYCDYNDSLSIDTIKEIMKCDNPRQAFEDKLMEWASDYDCYVSFENQFGYWINQLTSEDKEIYYEYEDEIRQAISNNVFYFYPENHFNKEVRVNIMLDTGNMNYDFTCDNILNWYGRGNRGEFDKNSSLLWLAKQQKKATLLKKTCKNIKTKENHQITNDKFIQSCVQELKNMTCALGTLTFLVKMSLFDLFELKANIKAEEELNKSYYLEERQGKGAIILDKKVECGLFDSWNGGGSVLEIQLDKDVIIPFKCIFDAVVDGTKIYGYDVDEVYGLIDNCWSKSFKGYTTIKQ